MKLNTKLILLLMLLVLPAATFAVTDKEMEHARTIAAKAYLRYANDLSGYLDNIHPTTMAELEKALKNKEKENIKAFKAIPVPTDYQSWDRQKLEEYWGTTVFKSKGLIEKGRAGRIGAKKDLKKMTVGAPEAKPEQPKPTAEPAKTQKEEPQATQPKAADAQKTSPTVETPSAEAALDSISAAEASLETAADLNSLDEEDPEIEKASNHTWIYILVLCILVGVVVALVVFASNVMKKNGIQNGGAQKGQERPSVGMVSSEASALRNDFADKLYAKSQEITDLNKKLQAQIKAGEVLQKNLDSLLAENGRLHARIAELQDILKSSKPEETAAQSQPAVPQAKVQVPQEHQAYQPKPVQPETPTQPHQAYQPQPAPAQPQQPKQETNGPIHRTIFLGRVNPRNKFVRADRALNPGHTVFQLETSDGLTGTYRVVADPSVWELALANPYDILAGGCNVADIIATAGKQKVVNDQAGTAIFEGGCWQVLRKAKVHFE